MPAAGDAKTAVVLLDTRQHTPDHEHAVHLKLADGTDVLVYHARQYTEIEGDPLWNPDRHTFVKTIRWDEQGMPVFGKPGQP